MERPRPFQTPSTIQPPTYTTPAPVTNYPYRPSGQPTTQQPPFSTQKQTYLPPSNQPYVPSSYNPRPSETSSYSNIGSSAFPPYSSTSSIQTPGYSTSGGVSKNYGYTTSNFPATSTPSGFSTTYGYSTQRPSPTYIEASTYRQPSAGYPSPNGYSYDQGGYPSSPGFPPSSTPGGAFPPQTGGGTTRPPSRLPSGPTGQGTMFSIAFSFQN